MISLVLLGLTVPEQNALSVRPETADRAPYTFWLDDPARRRGKSSPCAHPQVGRVLRGRQRAHRHVRPLPVRHVQCGRVRDLSEDAAAASHPPYANGAGAGQCPVPPRGPVLKPVRRTYRAVLTLLFLPPYSPQLAPIERVWKLARCLATHNRFFATWDDVLIAISTCFDRWRTPHSVLRRLCGII